MHCQQPNCQHKARFRVLSASMTESLCCGDHISRIVGGFMRGNRVVIVLPIQAARQGEMVVK